MSNNRIFAIFPACFNVEFAKESLVFLWCHEDWKMYVKGHLDISPKFGKMYISACGLAAGCSSPGGRRWSAESPMWDLYANVHLRPKRVPASITGSNEPSISCWAWQKPKLAPDCLLRRLCFSVSGSPLLRGSDLAARPFGHADWESRCEWKVRCTKKNRQRNTMLL